MVALVNALIEAAEERGIVAHATEPRTASARYDADDGRVVIDLTNRCSFAFPAHLAQRLETASDEQRTHIEILGAGYGLHWEALDVEILF